MHKLLLAALLNLSFFVSTAAFVQDTSFISYEEFSRLNKHEIKRQFGTDKESQKLIANYYKYNHKGFKKLWGIVPLTVIGSYFSMLSANATNGMGSTVGLVLAILFLLPASILLIVFVALLLNRKNKYSKKLLYEQLKQYFQSR